jgi:hypothetical protein
MARNIYFVLLSGRMIVNMAPLLHAMGDRIAMNKSTFIAGGRWPQLTSIQLVHHRHSNVCTHCTQGQVTVQLFMSAQTLPRCPTLE